MQPDPISYPTVSIGGQPIEVKYRCGDIIRLKKAGIDIGNLSKVTGVDAMQRTLTLLSAGIAHSMAKSADELADMIDIADLPRYANAINEAFSKVSAQTPSPEANQTTPVQ